MEEILISIISTIVGGLLVYFVQKYLEHRKKINIRPSKAEKIINSDIFDYIQPDTSLKKVEQILGPPQKQFDCLNILDDNDETDRKGFIYNFENCFIKITTSNYETVETITVSTKALSKNKLRFNYYELLEKDITLGKSKIDQSLINDGSGYCEVRTTKDISFGLVNSYGNPLYITVIYFGLPEGNKDFIIPERPDQLEGVVINTVCISSSHTVGFYIYTYEMM